MELKRRSFLKTVASTAFAYLFLKNNGKPEPAPAKPIPEIKPEEYHEKFQTTSITPTHNGSGYYGVTTGQFLYPCSGYVCLIPQFPKNRSLV